MVQVWTNGEDTENLNKIVEFLEKSVKDKSASEFKAFVIVVTDDEGKDKVAKALTEATEKAKIEKVGVAYLTKENRGVRGYRINLAPEVKNTVFVYRRKRVTDKFVNLKADEKGLAAFAEAINKVTAQ